MNTKDDLMALDEAKKLIWDDNASPAAWAIAAGIIYQQGNNNPQLYDDLLQCLRRKGACAGSGVLGLYLHSGRPHPEDFMDNCRDPEEWKNYLIGAGLIKPEAGN